MVRKTWVVAVAAVLICGCGSSKPSEPLSDAGTHQDSGTDAGTDAGVATVADAPTQVVAQAGNGEATVSWSAPADDGGSAITSYKVVASPGGQTVTVEAPTTSATVTGLSNGTSYTFTVVATNGVGDSAPSLPSAAVLVQASKAEAPTNVTAVGGDAKAVVSWTAPTDDGGSAITSYTVTSSPEGKTATVLAPATSVTVPDLTNGTDYTFTVVATNSGGDSAPSLPSAAVLVARAPDAPTGVSGVAANQRVTVSWIAPVNDGGSAIISYTVTASPGGASATVAAPATSATVTGLTNGTDYTFTVVATNSVGDSAPSPASAAIQAVQTVPSAPTGVVAQGKNESADVQWSAPEDDGGSALTLYTVTASPGGITATAAPPATSLTMTGLTNGTDYTFTVVATNAIGDSAPSAASEAVRVKDAPPSNLTYAHNPRKCQVGSFCVNSPSNEGGTIINFSISPALPPGLTFDGSTGELSGTAQRIQPRTRYTVVGTNTGGSTSTDFLLEVQASVMLAAGGAHACWDSFLGLTPGFCWGDNASGQLGNDTTTDSPSGVEHTGPGSVPLSAGLSHTCAVEAGVAYCWGDNAFGQLGDGTLTDRLEATQVSGLPGQVTSISAGLHHTCAVAFGGVWCWGDNSQGQLGDGTHLSRKTPVPVTSLSTGVRAVSAGASHTCALTDDALLCWGENADGELGNDSPGLMESTTPVPVTHLPSGILQSVSAGNHETCAMIGGSAWCWGSNGFGQLGNGSSDANSFVPVQVSGLSSDVASISVGDAHACALMDWNVWCWGRNNYGQLGDGTNTNSDVPVRVTLHDRNGEVTEAVGISAGRQFTCAMTNDLTSLLYSCWGHNDQGQLGDGTTTDSNLPTVH